MMVLIYTCMLIALLCAWFRYTNPAIFFYFLTFLLAIGWFLFHIHDEKYGFRMPWIQTHQYNDKGGLA